MIEHSVSRIIGRVVLGLGLWASLFLTLYSFVFLSPMVAPALVALFTFMMCNIPFYLRPADLVSPAVGRAADSSGSANGERLAS